MININLINQNGFKWQKDENMFFAGYLFDQENNYFSDKEALRFFREINDVDYLKLTLNKMNGIYALGIKVREGYAICSSHMRYIPVFYAKNNDSWHISDSCDEIIKHCGHRNIFDVSELEFLKQGFVRGNRTLFEDIFSIQAGEVVLLKENDYERSLYYKHPSEQFADTDIEVLEQQLKVVIDNVGLRLANSLKGKTAILPLSGGYDSRLIACMLKNAGIDNVICFTYGKENLEAEISKKVAERLGYNWIFIDYTEHFSNIDKIFSSKDFFEYANYAANGISMPYLQEYIAVKELQQKNLIPEDAVFIPGHSGGYLGGSFLGYRIFKSQAIDNIAQDILKNFFVFDKMSKKEKSLALRYLKKQHNWYISQLNIFKSIPYTITEGLAQQEWESKFILNSAKVFDYFGYECRFPYWDYELEGFFRNTPYKFRHHKFLFKKVLNENYFLPYGISFQQELQPKKHAYFLQNIKKPFRRFLPQPLRAKLLKKNDWMCYDEFTSVLQSQLDEPLKSYYMYNAIICNWYMNYTRKRYD